MNNLKNKLINFMTGRSGPDELNRFLLTVWVAAAITNIFFRSKVISALQLIPAVLFFLRFFSTNLSKRYGENRKYLEITGKLKKRLSFRRQQIKEIGTHRYIKCPKCGAIIRVPRRTGKHTLVCPKCSERFETNIII